MRFEQFYSSSSGNLYRVTSSGGRQLLLECGVTWKSLCSAIGYNMEQIDGVLLTHCHNDHSHSAEQVVEAGLNLFASQGTLEAIGLSNHQAHTVRDGCSINIGRDFRVFPFEVHHDCPEPLGFLVHDRVSNEDLFFATDTCNVTHRFGLAFHIIALECSYDEDIVRYCIEKELLPQVVANRLTESHMEKSMAMKYIKDYCCLENCREIHLLHMSSTALNREQTAQEFYEEFLREILWSKK